MNKRDTMVYSPDINREHLREVLETLQQNKLYTKFSKCELYLEKVAFLGHIISKDGVSWTPARWRPLVIGNHQVGHRDSKLFGFSRILSKIHQEFFKNGETLTQLTKKGVRYLWSEECEQNLKTLKEALTTRKRRVWCLLRCLRQRVRVCAHVAGPHDHICV